MMLKTKNQKKLEEKIDQLERRIISLEKFLDISCDIYYMKHTNSFDFHRPPNYSVRNSISLISLNKRIENFERFIYQIKNPAKFKKGDFVNIIENEYISSEVYYILDINFFEETYKWNYHIMNENFERKNIYEEFLRLSKDKFSCDKNEK